jgi:hypothetical protein
VLHALILILASTYLILDLAHAQQVHPQDRFRVRPYGVPVLEVAENDYLGSAAGARLLDRLRRAERFSVIGKQDTGEPHDLFGTVESVKIDAEGRVYVLDSSIQAIRVFSLDGTYVQTVGAPGGGPGEFTNLGAMALDQTSGTLYVADGARRLQKFVWRGDAENGLHLEYESLVHLDLHARGLCFLGNGFVAHTLAFAERSTSRLRPQVPNLLTFVDRSGDSGRSFGATYESPSVSVNLMNGWSILACDAKSGRVYITPTSNISETHAYDLDGNPQWIVLYTSARAADVLEWPEDRSVQQKIPPDGYHQVAATTVLDEGLLVQMTVRVAAAVRGSVRRGEVISYLLSPQDGTAVALPAAMPLIVAADTDHYVELLHAPNPQLIVYRVEELESR